MPSSLTHLRLDHTDVDAEILSKLPTGITHLSLNGTRMDSKAISELVKKKNLVELQIRTAHLRAFEMDAIENGLPNTKLNDLIFTGL